MLTDLFRKKSKRPNGGAPSELELEGLERGAPDIDSTLDEIDRALATADAIEQKLPAKKQSGCGCGS